MSSNLKTREDLISTEAELVAAGWQRSSVADDSRLEELVETYEEIGFEVKLLPVPMDDGACTECMKQDPDRYRIIYIRRIERKADAE
jgi:hypothetical protein